MKLLKVHVPDYRCLKNVILTFEPDLTPQVFPIGGENGGGKSTLLQLIFVLLHCSTELSRKIFLSNAIRKMKKPSENWELIKYDIATIQLLYKNEIIDLDYFLIPLTENTDKSISDLYEPYIKIISTVFTNNYTDITKFLDDSEKKFYNKIRLLNITSFQISYNNKICHFGIFCRSSHHDHRFSREVLDFAGKNIFIAGQPTQPYIFLNDNDIQELFNIEGKYSELLQNARKELPNFYT